MEIGHVDLWPVLTYVFALARQSRDPGRSTVYDR